MVVTGGTLGLGFECLGCEHEGQIVGGLQWKLKLSSTSKSKKNPFVVQSHAGGMIGICITLRREKMDRSRCNVVSCGVDSFCDSIHVLNFPGDRSLTVYLGLDFSETAKSFCATRTNGSSEIQKDGGDGAGRSGVDDDWKFTWNGRCENVWSLRYRAAVSIVAVDGCTQRGCLQ